jgi:hypothetical protein
MHHSSTVHLCSCALPPSTHLNFPAQRQRHVSSLFHLFIVSVLFVHAIFAMPLHAHTAPNCSTTRVLCLIIIVTLQLLWPFFHSFNITVCYAEIPQPLWQLRLFVFSVTVELSLSVSVTSSNPHPTVNFLHESSAFHW